ncbi:MerR family transcriptional regulator [Alkalihalobacillus deserti]|uniref:MerR family transcriptional regulator n=1 Tax=Alkalihalobacillus deserti TaxID=2879466 RepID=UPI001D134237|nr:MerR family transcriptional regulator [Alkalihalobacillus deserti]
MVNGQKKYTIKEVSKSLKIPVGKLREWEDLFPNALYVQRTKTGARLYKDYEIETLKKIKILKDHNISEENVNFIIDVNTEIKQEGQSDQSREYVEMLLSLQNETTETMQNLTDSFVRLKEEFIQDIKEELKTEMNVGHSKTTSLIQSYSNMIIDTADNTQEELIRIRQDFYREEEEKLFIQQKLEEREEQFQEFILSFRESAAAKQKQRFPNWLKIFKTKKDSSIDFS